jgi:hypothetical protein
MFRTTVNIFRLARQTLLAALRIPSFRRPLLSLPRRLMLGGGLFGWHMWSLKPMCYEDKVVIEARRTFESEIKKMEREFGQMALYPEVKVRQRGNTYSIEFEIDPRKCEVFGVLASFLQQFSKEEGFRLVGNNTMKQEALITMQLDFE